MQSYEPCQYCNPDGDGISSFPISKPQTIISHKRPSHLALTHSPIQQHISQPLSTLPPPSSPLPPQPHCLSCKNPATPIPCALPLPPCDLAQYIHNLPLLHQLPQPFYQIAPSFFFVFVFTTNMSKIPSPQPIQHPPQRLKSNTPLRRKRRPRQSRQFGYCIPCSVGRVAVVMEAFSCGDLCGEFGGE